jgi:glycosyltransferase involved in cell wall biosynthesis
VSGVPTIEVTHQPIHNSLLRQILYTIAVIPRMRAHIAAALSNTGVTIVHAQHILAARAAIPLKNNRTRVVITVRDHWPWDMQATGMHVAGDQRTARGVLQSMAQRHAPFWQRLMAPLYALQMRQRASLLARADLVIAVSDHMAHRVRQHIPGANVCAIPNMVDIGAIQQIIQTPPSIPIPAAFVLFVGKLSPNKGAQFLPELIRRIRPPAIVIAGDGPLQNAIAAAAAAVDVPCHILDWVAHDDVLRLMARCDALWFPSSWDEPLSRVLLEALACAAPIIAMPTGGTPEIIVDGVTGLLADTSDAFVHASQRLAGNLELQATLRYNSLAHARATYAQDIVIAQVLAQYDALGART